MYRRTLCTALIVLAGTVCVAEPVYFVAENGNDAWSGALAEPNAEGTDGPLASPARALALLRERAAAEGLSEGAAVYVRGGTYYLPEPLQMGADLSGTEGAPVVMRAYKQEKPRLVGGIALRDFEEEEGHLRFDLGDKGYPEGRFLEVYANGQRLMPARWPNLGEGDLPGGGWTFVGGRSEEARKRQFRFSGDRPGTWGGTGIEVSIWPNYNWWQTVASVSGIDPESRLVSLSGDLPYEIEPGRRLFFQHVREELDAPGEWYHDVEAKQLLVVPPAEGLEEVLVATLEHLLILDGAKHVQVLGFTLEGARGNAVKISNSEHCLLGKNVIRNVYGFGVTVEGGLAVEVRGNDIHDTGHGGIAVNGGDRATLTPGRHNIENNHIHRFARIMQTYNTGVNISGVGNRIAHNLIHDAPHIAILLGGNDHEILYNDIYDVCQESGDNGAFYMGRDWTQRGNVLKFNRFSDIYGFGLATPGASDGVYRYESPHQSWGVYLDDCSSGTLVYGNEFIRVPLCGVMVGGGRDNTVENNVFVECIPAWHIDDRWDSYPWELMQERYTAMNPQEPPYSERYPELADMGEDPRKPENNKFLRNIIRYSRDDFRGLSTTRSNPGSAAIYDFDQFDPESTAADYNLIDNGGYPVRVAWSVYKEADSFELLAWEAWREKGFDLGSLLAPAKFANPEEDNYNLRPDSDAFKLGFQKIPRHRVGLYQDEYRANWPPPARRSRGTVEHREYVVNLSGDTGGDQPQPEN